MKKLVSLVLSLLLIFCTMLSAFAIDTQTEASRDDNESINVLRKKCLDVADYYALSVPGVHDGYGSVKLSFEADSKTELNTAVQNAYNYCLDCDAGMTADENDIASLTEAIENAKQKVILSRAELKILVDICNDEKNDNGYYHDELWNDFTKSLENAVDIINDETITDHRVNAAYYDLLENFNSLCRQNTVVGDIDGDGRVAIMDATLIQLTLAKMESMNSSQIYVCDFNFSYEGEDLPSIMHATYLQKYIAKSFDKLESYALSSLINGYLELSPDYRVYYKDYELNRIYTFKRNGVLFGQN